MRWAETLLRTWPGARDLDREVPLSAIYTAATGTYHHTLAVVQTLVHLQKSVCHD
jgi:hypothetical protein